MPSLPSTGTEGDSPRAEEPVGSPGIDRLEAARDVPPWPAWTAPAVVGAGFALWFALSIVVSVGAKAGGTSLTHPTPAVSLISDLLFDASFVAAAVYFARYGGRIRATDFGFRAVRWPIAVTGVFIAGISYYVITAIYASLLGFHGNEKLPKELGVGKSDAALVAASIFVCVVAPIAEEFLFRGFIFGALRRMRITFAGRQLGTWVAALITAILFGLAHTGSAPLHYLIPLGFLGFVLCLLRWRSRSLYPCMALHSINNSLALGVTQLHWPGAEVIGLIAGSLIVIAALTGPLAGRAPAVA